MLSTRKIYQLLILTTSATSALSASQNDGKTAVVDVTNQLESCARSSLAFVEANYKKVCDYRGEKYFMKEATSDSLREAFAREFANNNLLIRAPDSIWMHETNGTIQNFLGFNRKSELYLSSKEVKGFRPAVNLFPELWRLLSPVSEYGFYAALRRNIVNAIGERGFAKLAVAMTFYNDLHFNNWGYTGNQLVLIDVDSMPDSIEGFFDAAIANIDYRFKWLGGALSLKNLKQMKSIYEAMLNRPVPAINSEVDMSHEMYQRLLHAYIEACFLAIKNVKAELSPYEMQSKPSQQITNILVDALKDVSVKYDATISRRVKNMIY